MEQFKQPELNLIGIGDRASKNFCKVLKTSHNIYIDKQIQLIQNLDKSKLSKLKILPKNVVNQTKTAKKCWLPV